MPAFAQHIAILFHDFSAGGTEMVALRLAAEWYRQGRRVTILCGTLDGPLIGSVPAGVHIRALEPEIGRSPLSRLRLRRRLPAMIEQLRPDVVFIPGNFHLVLAQSARRSTGRPAVVAKVSNPIAPTAISPIRWLIERLYRWAARDADTLVAMSSGLAGDIRALMGESRVRVIHDPNILPGVPHVPRAPRNGVLHMVAAGRLVPQKDFALAIRVAAEMARFQPVALTILGEGPQRRSLVRLARDLGIANSISLPGHVASIAQALAAADLLLVTSRYEGGPAVAVEALQSGVPVMATDCSHLLHDMVRHPDHGKILNSRVPSKIAAEVIEWLGRLDRRPFCGRSATETMDAPHAAAEYLGLFDELCAVRRPANGSTVTGSGLSGAIARRQ